MSREQKISLAPVAIAAGAICLAAWLIGPCSRFSPIGSSAATAAGAEAGIETPVETLIEQLIELVQENYVLEDGVPAIEIDLRTRLRKGEYLLLQEPGELSARLTQDLRSASGDLHFGIRPRPLGRPSGAGGQGANSNKKRPQGVAPDTPGIREVALLAGNVGYLELAAFPDPSVGAPAVDAAFHELAGTDALILDVRSSRGGHPGMVAHLFSYFFDGDPFLFNRLSWRNSGKTLEFWTQADLPSPRYTGRDVFVLTSRHTPSAAEGFTYHLKHFDRATVVGEPTAGAAHLSQIFELGEYQVAIPTGRPASLATGGNWEGVGVQPDREVSAEDALEFAHRLALEGLLASAGEPAMRERLLKAIATLAE